MIFGAFIIFVEFFLCNLIISPSDTTEYNTAAFILLGINVFVVCFAISLSVKNKANDDEERKVRYMMYLSFFLRIAILLWDVYARDIYILPNSEGDAEWYHINGVRYAFGYLSNTVDYNRYSYYVGQIYKIIGVQKVTVQFLHVFLAIWSIVLIYKILTMFKIESKIKVRAMAFVCFLPNLMMITTFFLQESVIAFLIILSFYFYSKWWFSHNYLFIVLSVAASLMASALHTGGIVVAVGVLSLVFVVSGKEHKIKLSFGRIVSMVALMFIGLWILSQFGDAFLGRLRGGLSAESVLYETEVREGGGAGYAVGISGLPASLDLIVNTPIRMLYFVFSPLPWTWRGLNDIIAFFGSSIFYIYVVYSLIKAIREKPIKNLRNDSIVSYFFVLMVVVAIASIMFGWGVANAGSALRHREKFTYLFVVLFAISQEIVFRVEKQREKNSIDNRSGLQRRKVSSKMHHYYRKSNL